MNLIIFSFISAIIDWFSVLLQIKWLEYIFKPLTIIVLILWFFQRLPSDKPIFVWIIIIGLVFSLFGDTFLMLPGDWFLAGLIAFFFAQIAYAVGFNSDGLQLRWETALIAVVIFIIAGVVYLQLRNGLKASGSESLILPVTLYVIVISIMLWSASTTFFRDDWQTQAAILVTIGAGFFFISDAVLGWNRFVNEIPSGNLIVIMTYHTAQYLISFGVLSRLGLLQGGLFG